MGTEQMVLAIDDEPGILRVIKLELSAQGFRVLTAGSGSEGLRMAEEHRPDLVLLDIVMPEMNGLEVMRELRERSNVPIIMLTAKRSETDKVMGLEMGADDYLPKPFSLDELSARVRAVLRRSSATPNVESIVRVEDVEIDLGRRLVKRDGDLVNLTRTEWMLLQCLAANAGKVMLNAELLSKVWGPEYVGDLQYLRVWVSRLRGKLEREPSEPKIIRTFQGVGYMLTSDESAKDGAKDDAAEAGGEASEEPAATSEPALQSQGSSSGY
ncbi:MAG: response regulator transcription factor [Dehalococcoidia bacterium]